MAQKMYHYIMYIYTSSYFLEKNGSFLKIQKSLKNYLQYSTYLLL